MQLQQELHNKSNFELKFEPVKDQRFRIVLDSKFHEYRRNAYADLKKSPGKEDVCNTCWEIATLLQDPNLDPESVEKQHLIIAKNQHYNVARRQQAIVRKLVSEYGFQNRGLSNEVSTI